MEEFLGILIISIDSIDIIHWVVKGITSLRKVILASASQPMGREKFCHKLKIFWKKL